MRKRLLFGVFALIGLTSSTFAQSETTGTSNPIVSISPNPADTLQSKDFTATFTFNTAVTYDSVYFTSGNIVNKIPVSVTEASTTVSVPVIASYWSNDVVAGLNMLEVSLIGVTDENDNPIDYSSGIPGRVNTSFRYLTTATPTAKYVGADQDPYWMLAQDLVDNPITFMFTDSVTMTNVNATAVVNYYLDDEIEAYDPAYIAANEIHSGNVPRTNYYGLAFCIPNVEDWSIVKYITICLQGIKSNDVEVQLECPLIKFDTSFEDEISPNAENKQNIRIVEGIQTMEGVSVSKKADKPTVNSLKPGMYIINGKKVFIK